MGCGQASIYVAAGPAGGGRAASLSLGRVLAAEASHSEGNPTSIIIHRRVTTTARRTLFHPFSFLLQAAAAASGIPYRPITTLTISRSLSVSPASEENPSFYLLVLSDKGQVPAGLRKKASVGKFGAHLRSLTRCGPRDGRRERKHPCGMTTWETAFSLDGLYRLSLTTQARVRPLPPSFRYGFSARISQTTNTAGLVMSDRATNRHLHLDTDPVQIRLRWTARRKGSPDHVQCRRRCFGAAWDDDQPAPSCREDGGHAKTTSCLRLHSERQKCGRRRGVSASTAANRPSLDIGFSLRFWSCALGCSSPSS